MILSESIPDISYYNKALDSSFNKRGVIFRLGDGNAFLDPLFAHNLAVAQQLYAAGKLDLFGIYHVYRPVGAGTLFGWITTHLPKLPAGAFWVNDLETWGGQITGDHSGDLNTLYGMTSAWAGSLNRSLEYGNVGDISSLHRSRDARIKIIEAGYGSTAVHLSNAICKQWTNGQPQYDIPGLSAITSPMGRCDHNVFIGMDLAQVAAALDITPATLPAQEDDMYLLMDPIPGDDPSGAWYKTDGLSTLVNISIVEMGWETGNAFKVVAENRAQVDELVANINTERVSRGWPMIYVRDADNVFRAHPAAPAQSPVAPATGTFPTVADIASATAAKLTGGQIK